MKSFKLLLPLLFVGFLVSSCGKETCETCTVTQTITQDGEVVGTQTLNTNQEYCGDALDAIKATEATATQELGGITQEIVTTVTCE